MEVRAFLRFCSEQALARTPLISSTVFFVIVPFVQFEEIGRATIYVAIIACLHITPVWARSRPAWKRASVGSDYIAALATANRFLQAWQSHDQETGLLLLSDAAKQKSSPDNLEAFFSSGQGAYEITRGKETGGGQYCFSVVLFEVGERAHPRHVYSELLVRKVGKNDWIIDTLPRL